MKVGLVVRHFNPARGGAERWTHELARRALAAGHEVHVVAQSFGPAEHALPIVLSDTTRRALADAPALRALGSIAIRGRVDPVACWAIDGDGAGL